MYLDHLLVAFGLMVSHHVLKRMTLKESPLPASKVKYGVIHFTFMKIIDVENKQSMQGNIID